MIITKAPHYFATCLNMLINATFNPSDRGIAAVFLTERHFTFIATEGSLNIDHFSTWIKVLSTHITVKMNGLAHCSTSLYLVVGYLEALIPIPVGNPLQDVFIATIVLTNHRTQPFTLPDVSFYQFFSYIV
jgi:hypothetical protein